jgi:Fic family protein
MCEYVNDNLHIKNAFHLASYVMWRHNWIHPFVDGNGRTSRVLSYIVLSICAGYVLPGTPTIPEQIQEDRAEYFKALEAADSVWREEQRIDVSEMEKMLTNMLAKQLLSVINTASGGAVGV